VVGLQSERAAHLPLSIVEQTYLHHIYEHYDDLARHTMFMQAKIHHIGNIVKPRLQLLTNSTGHMFLSGMFGCS
jgi:hypothetical protein